ncbi:L,D-transpeptidase family protein [Thioclava sp. A2]|uniref:L,D-transpeptidase family protein n=1 Tax=Thioclava sp. FCG-A2 TaxID=3080562 RepID=UPI0029536047|nr:L,D-transpeptidase family protein [Thioclava sp. A2]MDV7272032.1 L,D-transpeptidase family protein [Thioclava sp. A2]
MRLTPRGLCAFGRLLPVEVGRGGLSTDKREGDGATPVGLLHIAGMLYRPDRIAPPQPWAQSIGPRDLWCDAPDHPAYNLPVKAAFPASHEALRRADPLYDIVLLTDWNFPHAVAGKGSAIFLHQRRRQGFPTAGCLAFRRDHLIWLAGRVSLGEPLLIPPLAGFAPRGGNTVAGDKA